MKHIIYKLALICISLTFCLSIQAGDDEIMITRDGQMLTVNIISINGSQITFKNVKKKKNTLKAPTDYVYMILREKGKCIYFDETGDQMTIEKPEVDMEKDVILFLNDGKVLHIYNYSINKEDITYQLKDKKKAPVYKSEKSEVFMLKDGEDGTTLFNNNYINSHSAAAKTAAQTPQATQPAQTTQPATVASQAAGAVAGAAATVAGVAATAVQTPEAAPSVATAVPSATTQTPGAEVDYKDIYAFTMKGGYIKYAFKRNDKLAAYMMMECQDCQKVDNKYQSKVHSVALNKKGEKMKTAVGSGDVISMTDINADGSYILAQDYILAYAGEKRSGYLLKIPANLKVGDKIEGGTLSFTYKAPLTPTCRNTITANDFTVVSEENVQTEAGTFKCLKVVGTITGTFQKMKLNDKQTWYIAKAMGIIKQESDYYGHITVEAAQTNIQQ